MTAVIALHTVERKPDPNKPYQRLKPGTEFDCDGDELQTLLKNKAVAIKGSSDHQANRLHLETLAQQSAELTPSQQVALHPVTEPLPPVEHPAIPPAESVIGEQVKQDGSTTAENVPAEKVAATETPDAAPTESKKPVAKKAAASDDML